MAAGEAEYTEIHRSPPLLRIKHCISAEKDECLSLATACLGSAQTGRMLERPKDGRKHLSEPEPTSSFRICKREIRRPISMMTQFDSIAFRNKTTIPLRNWQPEPNTRGTWSIISTCLITLTLCLWTALHLNIPEHNGDTRQRWRKVGWLLIGLLAPEMVVCTALLQRMRAMRLTKMMQAKFGGKPESEWRNSKYAFIFRKTQPGSDGPSVEMNEFQSQAFKRRHPWTHVHSFYVIMGGFAFDTSSAKPNFLPHGRSRLTLRIRALKYLVEHAPHLIPDLSEEEIRDKSKADGLAKLLVCLQGIWFCLQCIVRLAQEQAISFLELNTFGHALCALLLYALWWYKPLDINSPTLLEGHEAWEICALMCVCSNGEIWWNNVISDFLLKSFSVIHENRYETELSRGQKYGDTVFTEWTDVFNGRHQARLHRHRFEPRMILRWDPVPAFPLDQTQISDGLQHLEPQRQSRTPSTEGPRIKRGRSLFGFRCMDVYTQADWYRANISPLTISENELKYRDQTILRDTQDRATAATFERECTLQASDLFRWELVSRAWKKYQPKQYEYDHFAPQDSETALLNNCVCDHAQNWPIGLDRSDATNLSITLMLTLAGGLYGGLHLLAWNALFTSWSGQILWRASGILVASTGLIWPGIMLKNYILAGSLHDHSPSESPKWMQTLMTYLPAITNAMVGLFVTIILIAYILARGYLITECWMQVTRLPPAAYDLPEWARYYPHIG